MLFHWILIISYLSFESLFNLILSVYTFDFKKKRRRRKLALFMKRIINFQQMIRCKEVLLRKDWRIINLLRVAGLQEDGQARDEGVSIKRISTSKEFKRRSSVGS